VPGPPGPTGPPGPVPEAPTDGANYTRKSSAWSNIDTALALLAPLASPTLTGDPKAPTPTAGDSDTSIATTAFVAAAVAAGGAGTGAVRYDGPQALTLLQQHQARTNIYAAPLDALAYSGMQINGGFEINQIYSPSGFSIPGGAATYFTDGWFAYFNGSARATIYQSPQAFAGFPSYLNLLVTTAEPSLVAGDFYLIQQSIEGLRTSRLAWGSGAAQPITIAFWTSHHRTGLYSVSIRNGAANRSYVATYTQNAADTPEYKTITIPGDTAGSWAIDNTLGLSVVFCLGCGANLTAPSANAWLAGNYVAAPGQINSVAATSDEFRLSGVVVLPGIDAPFSYYAPLIMRPADQELLVCQRYFRWVGFNVYLNATAAGQAMLSNTILCPVMRAAPSVGGLVADPSASPVNNNVQSTAFSYITPYSFAEQITATAANTAYILGWRCYADARL
jgi:hypothetical protein